MSATEVGVDEALVEKAEAAWVRHHHLGTTAAARAVLAAVADDLRSEGERAERIRWSAMLGYGNDVTEPAVTAKEFSDVWADVSYAADGHDLCPVWCDDCDAEGQWERPRSCKHCNGSGCGPATALGAYDPCEHCAGNGRDHQPYWLTLPAHPRSP